MRRVCIVVEANVAKDPRPKRLINILKEKFIIVAIGRESDAIDGVEVLSYPIPRQRSVKEEIALEESVKKKDFIKLVKIPNRMTIAEILQKREFDIIFCHDLVLLPIVLENKKSAKVIVDLREYYPRQMECNERWLRLFAPFNDYLCQTYLKQADCVYTVCDGIAKEYEKNYGIKCDVITSAAHYYAPPPPLICPYRKNQTYLSRNGK